MQVSTPIYRHPNRSEAEVVRRANAENCLAARLPPRLSRRPKPPVARVRAYLPSSQEIAERRMDRKRRMAGEDEGREGLNTEAGRDDAGRNGVQPRVWVDFQVLLRGLSIGDLETPCLFFGLVGGQGGRGRTSGAEKKGDFWTGGGASTPCPVRHFRTRASHPMSGNRTCGYELADTYQNRTKK